MIGWAELLCPRSWLGRKERCAVDPQRKIVTKPLGRDGVAEPEVWWGKDGIDGLLWADPAPPYAEPLSDTDRQNIPPPTGDPR